jgi:hypothetical protein
MLSPMASGDGWDSWCSGGEPVDFWTEPQENNGIKVGDRTQAAWQPGTEEERAPKLQAAWTAVRGRDFCPRGFQKDCWRS